MRRFYPLLFGLLLSLNLSAQNCLPGYSYLGEFEDHHYYMSNFEVHPSQAYAAANSLGVYLASIGSAAENAWLAPKVGDYKTIGFSDVDNEGDFVWHSGEPAGYTSWYPGEPNNTYYPIQNMYENYTVINFGCTGCWNDVPDWTSQRFVIEVEDDDCDGVSNVCDLCPGGDDSVDNNNDGLPDCAYYPGFEGLSPDWICGKNKVLVCHRPPDNPSNSHTICISKNAIPDHTGHGDYIGPCTGCGYALQSSGNSSNSYYRNGLDPDDMTIFPNPASEEFNIRIPETELETTLSIFDIQGRTIWTQRISPHADRTITVNAQMTGYGIFAVVARSGDNTHTERLVVQR